MVSSLAAVCEQLVQDVCDDEECYQAHFPSECQISLPAISCRTYCNLLRPELNKLLEQKLETGQSFFTLFRAVHHLEQITLRWAPGVLGAERCLCSSEGSLPFRPHIENWMRGTRTKLMQWSMRLLKEEVWQHPAGSMGGIVCSPSLVELFRALCSVAEDNAFVSATHPAYAGLMERSLSKVVVVHVSGLERLCQGEMPAGSGSRLLRSLGSRSGTTPTRGSHFRPSNTLCMLLNDMREIRSKQADLANAMRASLPSEWWGRSVDSNLREKIRLGDRFKACQVEIERRYAMVLHHVVKRMMEGLSTVLAQTLAQPLADESRAEPITNHLDEQLAGVAPRMDTRVQRRVARELWNSVAGALHDDLLDCQEGQSSNMHHSLGNIGPRIQQVDSVLKAVTDHIVGHDLTGLSQEDEPEKVMKLRKMLALFMREDEGKSIESL